MTPKLCYYCLNTFFFYHRDLKELFSFIWMITCGVVFLILFSWESLFRGMMKYCRCAYDERMEKSRSEGEVFGGMVDEVWMVEGFCRSQDG